ncbi:MAG: hypothetical protein WA687_02980 [Solirubrobacterales bacterium]
MIRSLKILVLALVAALAMSAGGLSTALAQEEQGLLTSEKSTPVTLTAKETGGAGANALTAFGAKAECPGSTYTGHKYNVTPHALILSGATRVTLTPHYKQENCIVAGIWRMTVEMNGCDYVLNIGETTPIGNEEGTYGVTTDIVCPGGKSIAITMYKTEPKHDNDEPFCILKLKEQAGLKGAHATDLGNGYIDIAGTFEGIHIDKAGIEAPFFCPNQTTSTGKLDVDLTVEAVNGTGDPTAISISD